MADMAAAGRGVHHDDVSLLYKGGKHGLVRVGSAYGPHIGMGAAEKRLYIVAQIALDLVDELGTLIVPLTRMSLRVTVGEIRAGELSHRLGEHVLARDEIDRALSPRILPPHGIINFLDVLFEHIFGSCM